MSSQELVLEGEKGKEVAACSTLISSGGSSVPPHAALNHRGKGRPGFPGTLSPSPVFQEHDAFQLAKRALQLINLAVKVIGFQFPPLCPQFFPSHHPQCPAPLPYCTKEGREEPNKGNSTREESGHPLSRF